MKVVCLAQLRVRLQNSKWLPNSVDSSMAQKLYKKTMRRMVVPVIVGNQQCAEVDGTQE